MNGRSRLLAVVAVFLLFYIPPTLNWFSNKNIATDILRNGTLLESINTDAVIVRSESLVYATADGVSISTVNEGERVAGNSRVATVYNKASLELMEELKQKNRLILENQHEKLAGSSSVVGEAQSIEGDIYQLIGRMVPDLNRNSLSLASIQAGEIDKLVLKKAEVYSNIPSDDAYINQLKKEKQNIEAQLSAVSNDVYSAQAGHISYKIDNFEDRLTFDKVSQMTVEDFKRVLSDAKGSQQFTTEYANGGIVVSQGKPFSKVVEQNVFYLVLRLDPETAKKFEVGDMVVIRTNSPFREFSNSEIVNLTEPSDGGVLATIRLTKYLFEFLGDRVINVDVIEKYQEGLKVSVRCLKNFEPDKEDAEIVLVKANNASVRKVRILATNGIYAIIESYDPKDSAKTVSVYNTYVRDATNIEDGMVLIR